MDLFEKQARETEQRSTPLADRMRPKKLSDLVGQEHLVGEGKVVQTAITRDELMSMIFWGPPGVGKTTLAKIIARETSSDFFEMSAVSAGVADIRKTLEKARVNRQLGKRTILFIDEIHRFNKSQQDALLHRVEDGTVLLIGATTENPSFEVNSPLLSRCRVYKLKSLSQDQIAAVLQRALQTDFLLSKEEVEFSEGSLDTLINLSGGDARSALNALELVVHTSQRSDSGGVRIDSETIKETLQTRTALYDKKGEYHYDVISAFIKSVRGSDPDAAIYWLARMLEAGEDPKFIARRLIILASEDVGNADPNALAIATSAFTAVTYIGLPEGRIVLAQATTYLASAPKSNASYLAIKAAQSDIRDLPAGPVPLHLRNAPTRLMKDEGYGEGYIYPHDCDESFAPQNYMPDNLKERVYYRPTENGKEQEIRERLHRWWAKYRGKKPT